MSKALFLMHHHKEFTFNHNSSWVKPSYTKMKGDWQPTENKNNYIDVLNSDTSILELLKYYPDTKTKDFIKSMGVEASIYYLTYNNVDEDYIGCSAYGRYLLISNESNIKDFKITRSIDKQEIESISSEKHLNRALEIFTEYDIITNFDKYVGCSIEEQYLRHQSPEHWHKFKEGIYSLYPEYHPYMDWFTKSEWANFQAPFLIKKKLFKKIFNQFFNVMKYVWENVNEVWPVHGNGIAEEFPYRYPGFLNERFFPFFLFANDVKRYNVPLIEFRDFNKQVF